MLVSDAKTEKSACCCDVRIGSFADKKECQGLAHFLEHMLFMGKISSLMLKTNIYICIDI